MLEVERNPVKIDPSAKSPATAVPSAATPVTTSGPTRGCF